MFRGGVHFPSCRVYVDNAIDGGSSLLDSWPGTDCVDAWDGKIGKRQIYRAARVMYPELTNAPLLIGSFFLNNYYEVG